MPSGFNIDSEFSRRAALMFGGGTVLWGVLIARLVQLQGLDRERLERLSIENQYNFEPAIASRGVIYDRFGVALAIDKSDFRIWITPEKIYKSDIYSQSADRETRLKAALDALGSVVYLPDALKARVLREAKRNSAFNPIQVLNGASWEDVARVNVLAPELPGIEGKLGRVRAYPHGPVFGHVLGYVSKPNETEITGLEAKLSLDPNVELAAKKSEAEARPDIGSKTPLAREIAALNDLSLCPEVAPRTLEERQQILRIARSPDYRLGKAGIESCAQNWLEGQHGVTAVLVTAKGRRLEEDREKSRAAKPGTDIVTTLDADLQEFAFRRIGADSAAAVVMDCQNGDLYCLLSAPSYDPNDFVNGVRTSEYRALLQDDHKPLYAKATKGLYPPGSTFKMMTGLAALEAGVDPDERVQCSGSFQLGNNRFHCWRRGGHGSMDLHNGIKHSCDVYFYTMALRAGVERIAKIAALFGFGSSFDIGIPDIARGICPDNEWKKKRYNQPWTAGDTANYAIGQGYVIASPLQLAVMAARLGNGYKKVVPRLFRPSGDDAAVLNQAGDIGISKEHLALVIGGMNGVSNEPGGTAFAGSQMDLPSGEKLAGKTGSAQVRRITVAERARGVLRNDQLPWELRDHALFVCIAPVDKPRYACAVVVEHGSSGAKTAAPLARDIMRETLIRDPQRQPVFQAPRPALDQVAFEGADGSGGFHIGKSGKQAS